MKRNWKDHSGKEYFNNSMIHCANKFPLLKILFNKLSSRAQTTKEKQLVLHIVFGG